MTFPKPTRPALATAGLAAGLAASLLAVAAPPTPALAQQQPAAASPATREAGAADALERADADMARVLRAHAKLGPMPIETLTPEQARRQPTPARAVQAVAAAQGKPVLPRDGVTTLDIAIPGPAGEIPARVYTPQGRAPFPVVVFYHGGGWVIADLETYDASARALAREANALVISAHYRQGPEHRFPAAHEDAFAAYKWAVQNAAELNGDPSRVAVAGESAGGNLAANVAIMARDQQVQAPVHQVLIYPIAGNDPDNRSFRENENAKPLNKAMVAWFVSHALRPEDAASPVINLVAADLKGLPPATVVTAEIDPLRSEGLLLAERLRAAGVAVTARDYDGVTHEFFGMDAAVADARYAQDVVGRQLREAFATRRGQ